MSMNFLGRLILGWMKELSYLLGGGFLAVRRRWMKYQILLLIAAAEKAILPPFLDIRRLNCELAPLRFSTL